MKKFLVLFCLPAQVVKDWIQNVDEAERGKQMAQMMSDWQKWMETHKANIVEGSSIPVGKTKRVTKEGVTDARNEVNYSMVVMAGSHDEAAALFSDNPHFMIPQAYIDVSDASNPGM